MADGRWPRELADIPYLNGRWQVSGESFKSANGHRSPANDSLGAVRRTFAAVHASFYTTCRQVIYSSMTQEYLCAPYLKKGLYEKTTDTTNCCCSTEFGSIRTKNFRGRKRPAGQRTRKNYCIPVKSK